MANAVDPMNDEKLKEELLKEIARVCETFFPMTVEVTIKKQKKKWKKQSNTQGSI